MKFYAVKSLFYTADLYTVETDSDGRTVRERFRETLRLSLDTGDGNALAIDSDTPVLVNTVIRNIKDRSGVLIYPSPDSNSGYSYRVYHEEPILSPFGTREGFTARAERVGA